MKDLMTSVEEFVNKVNNENIDYYTEHYSSLTPKPITIETRGSKYIKLIRDKSVWGFVSKYDGIYKGSPIRVGDLLKAAGWSSPAKHSRGNIIDGTASYNVWGPDYLK